jgi:hypothetical protein
MHFQKLCHKQKMKAKAIITKASYRKTSHYDVRKRKFATLIVKVLALGCNNKTRFSEFLLLTCTVKRLQIANN